MADDFGLKIGLEGEKEFKKALSDINQSFKVLGSEMKVVQSQFDKNDNSVESLAARNQVLNKEIEAQKQKIETLRSALDNAATSFGENDRRTQNWQIQLNNATATLNEMERELDRNNTALDEAEREMDDVADSADDMGEEIEEAGDSADKSKSKFDGLGGVLKGVGAAMGTVAVAAGAAAVKLGKEVIEAYADYEQLVGGVDTLFKDSSQELQNYAANAYKTAGMSANDYMETVTSFSASLIQSLDGNTQEAVKYADMAITDMSDNANKMGTDISLIQNAYQGFAKQNYTMLDNLKLGYGGTKTEMERLLADAQAISGIEYDISSYADVVEAIHVIQESMGVAGATAAEAEGTISGSLNATQAALQNLLVGFGDADADMEMLCQNLVDSLQNVITNITPVIENMVKVLPTITSALLTAIADLLPTLLETVTELFSQLLSTILTLLPELIPAAVQAIMTIVQALIDNLPLLIEAAVQLVASLVEGIGSALPELIPAAVEAVITIVQGLLDNLPMLLDAALQLILGLAEGLLAAIPQLIQALPEIITSIVAFLIGAIPQIIEAGVKLLISLVANLPTIIVEIVKAIPQIIAGIVQGFAQGVGQLAEVGGNLVRGLWQGIQSLASWLWNKVSGWISSIWDGICDFFGIHSPSDEMAWVGEMLVEGLSGAIDASGVKAVKSAEHMAEDINGVMHGIADDIGKEIPTDFDFSANVGYTADQMAMAGLGSGLSGIFNLNQPIMIDGKTITTIVSQIQYSQGRATIRNLGTA